MQEELRVMGAKCAGKKYTDVTSQVTMDSRKYDYNLSRDSTDYILLYIPTPYAHTRLHLSYSARRATRHVDILFR